MWSHIPGCRRSLKSLERAAVGCRGASRALQAGCRGPIAGAHAPWHKESKTVEFLNFGYELRVPALIKAGWVHAVTCDIYISATAYFMSHNHNEVFFGYV
jgi:hypothetical protein